VTTLLRGRPRRVVATAAAALCALTVVGARGAAPAHAGDYTTNCPRPESLVPNTVWHRYTLTKGVVLSEGQAKDRKGIVSMHVLTVDLTQRGISLRPLTRHLAQRSALSSLAAGKPHLIAATNTAYYDFDTGAPLGPVVFQSRPMTAFASGRPVVGIGTDHLVRWGHLRLAGTVKAGTTRTLAALNVLNVPTGLTLFTPKWGDRRVRVPYGAVTRYVTSGKVSSGAGRYTSPPTSGQLMLVARGQQAATWLSGLKRGTAVTTRLAVKSDTTVALTQAYQAGTTIVAKPGVVRSGLRCRARYPQPARTAVGIANGGRKLMLVVVTDHPGTSMHGLTASQMSKLMVELGAAHAYLFDGSGSSEMLARVPVSSDLTLRNYPADGTERTMPVGLGIFRS
jgi:hypothetical protein